MSQELELRIYDRSITTGEHRKLRQAATDAIQSGEVTYLSVPEGRAAIVPEVAAQWWEAYLAGLCVMCATGKHARCSRYLNEVECNCLNADVHHAIEMERAARAGLLSRRYR
jgi:hypothetical protein